MPSHSSSSRLTMTLATSDRLPVLRQRLTDWRWRLARRIAPGLFIAARPSRKGLTRIVVMPNGWEDGQPILEIELDRWRLREYRDPKQDVFDVTSFGDVSKTYLVPMRQRYFTGHIG